MKETFVLKVKSVLLAEDDDDDFNFFNSAILSVLKGVNVLRTENGVMLSCIIETSITPDLIFLDINMPFKSGISCLQAIRSNKKYNKTKVIIYSTSNNIKEVNHCYANGADFYLVKPSCYFSIVKQLKGLFSNEYFIKNIRPAREEFVFDEEKRVSCIS